MAKSNKTYNYVRKDVMRAFIFNRSDAYIPLSETRSVRVPASLFDGKANFEYVYFDVSKDWLERQLTLTRNPLDLFEAAKMDKQFLLLKFE